MKDGQLREYSYPRAEPFSLEVVTERLRKFRLLIVMLQIFLYLLVSSHLHDQIETDTRTPMAPDIDEPD